MKRKLVKQGLSTMMVSLPSAWIKSCSLKKGDEVEIEERGELLLLCSVNDKKIQKTQISISAKGSLVPSHLLALYLKGYDEITLRFEDSSVLKSLNETLKEKVPGFTITDSGKDFCKIRVIEESRKGDYESSIEKALSLLINLLNNLLEIIGSKDYFRTKSLFYVEDSCMRVINLSLRNLNKYGARDYSNTSLLYSVCETFNLILSEFMSIREVIEDLKPNEKLSPDILTVFKSIDMIMHKYYNLNQHYKDDSASKLLYSCEDLIKEIKLKEKNRTSEEMRLLFSAQKIIEYVKAIIKKEVVLNP